MACSSSNEDQFEYQEEKVLDKESGDEYSMEKFDTLTVVHIDGTQEEILVKMRLLWL
ncbi:hypothetical protein QWY93_18980 [Echinicola jeungdonensis]|uniref:hypothetical protein n=1 Tax=Echinicola jeungdonensis TaxID=709343 RepID=UPI0025B2A68A|nr:hypothetical protein [Echinicola jeungdonensis]MDN3671353.1 hypothetical protein [Echinicola jeungdonensis]